MTASVIVCGAGKPKIDGAELPKAKIQATHNNDVISLLQLRRSVNIATRTIEINTTPLSHNPLRSL